MNAIHTLVPPSESPARLLLVDDETDNLDLLERMFARQPVELWRALNGEQALLQLDSDLCFDAVLLDRMMPGLDGLEVLRRLKADPRHTHLPIILQTAAGNAKQVIEGLEAGAYYYLVKPFERAQLFPIVRGAVESYRHLRELDQALSGVNPLGLIEQGRFRLRTPAEANELVRWLARAGGDPGPVAFGLQALISNAIEHGNLEIGYQAKRKALIEGAWPALLASRLDDPRYRQRSVLVELERNAGQVCYRISDEGSGFDYQQYLRPRGERLIDPNGRGILVARDLSFDSLHYNEAGNQVEARVDVGGWEEL
ncbi:response regulator [Pseudomarimonas arenosa]|uniref:Response regulator n=1 Tax=Pseudomarimonas arenosa TaxID=2774145 RepID=A0AAW3ZNK4_9GAMM|nr:response regulator [Pseudomarimonas arenosa]MBD8526214.1 response regulator [Pseudomarimonas arenosa]